MRIIRDPTLTKSVVSTEALLKETRIELVSLVWSMGSVELEGRLNEKKQLTPKQRVE